MKRRQVRSFVLCLVLSITSIFAKADLANAEDKKIKWLDVTYLLNEWVDCDQPLYKEFVFLTIYYEDGSVEQKQGVERIFPYVLKPGCQNRIEVEYKGVTGEFFVWGKEEETPKNTTPAAVTIKPMETVTAAGIREQPIGSPAVTSSPKPDKILASPTRCPKPVYKITSGKKGIYLTKEKVKTYPVYTNQNINLQFGTSNIKKIEYQLVKKGNKRTDKWKTLNNHKIVLKKQGFYVLYLRFTTLSEEKIVRHTNGFVLDKTAPVISGVKNNRTYRKSVTLSYKDKISGVKKAVINGKKLEKKTKIKKSGTYQVEVTDRADNKKKVKFTVSIPTPRPTPKPTPKPTAPPADRPTAEPTKPPYIPVSSVTAPSSLSVKKGESKKISYQIAPSNATDKRVSFTSANKNIVTVSANGTVKGVAAGVASVVIRSRSDSTKYATCVVYVR